MHRVVIELLLLVVLAHAVLHVPHCVPWLLVIVFEVATASFDRGWFASVMLPVESLNVVAVVDVVRNNCCVVVDDNGIVILLVVGVLVGFSVDLFRVAVLNFVVSVVGGWIVVVVARILVVLGDLIVWVVAVFGSVTAMLEHGISLLAN